MMMFKSYEQFVFVFGLLVTARSRTTDAAFYHSFPATSPSTHTVDNPIVGLRRRSNRSGRRTFSKTRIHTTYPSSLQQQQQRTTQGGPLSTTKQDVDYESLEKLGYTKGLCDSLVDSSDVFAKRFWILDNSGSMHCADGKRLVVNDDDEHSVSMEECTRWEELQDTVCYHAELAGHLHAPTEFILLNSKVGLLPGRCTASRFQVESPRDVANAQRTIRRAEPFGFTPLAKCVNEVKKEIVKMATQLQQDQTKVAIVIATDGLPTIDEKSYLNQEKANEEFVQALRSLEGLPVWLVIRLCTDTQYVIDFYNSLDEEVDLQMDVLDDFTSEAQEIHDHGNTWLNYGLPLHRIREMGAANRLYDLLDERQLTNEEVQDFTTLVYGKDDNKDSSNTSSNKAMMMENTAGCKTTKKIISCLFQRQQPPTTEEESQRTWNPISKRVEPWIDFTVMKEPVEPAIV